MIFILKYFLPSQFNMQKQAQSHLQTNSNTGSTYSIHLANQLQTETCLKTLIIHAQFCMLPLGVQKWHNLHLKSASVFKCILLIVLWAVHPCACMLFNFFFFFTQMSRQTSRDICQNFLQSTVSLHLNLPPPYRQRTSPHPIICFTRTHITIPTAATSVKSQL